MSGPSSISCFNCGYSYGGLAADSACPECGLVYLHTEASRALSELMPLPARNVKLFRLLGALHLLATCALIVIPLYPLYEKLFPGQLIKSPLIAGVLAATITWLLIELTWCFLPQFISPVVAPATTGGTIVSARLTFGLLSLATFGGVVGFVSNAGWVDVLAFSCAALAVVSSLVGAICAALLINRIVRSLRFSRVPLLLALHWSAFAMLFCSITAYFLFFRWPWVGALIPVGPALASFRYFVLARVIRHVLTTHGFDPHPNH